MFGVLSGQTWRQYRKQYGPALGVPIIIAGRRNFRSEHITATEVLRSRIWGSGLGKCRAMNAPIFSDFSRLSNRFALHGRPFELSSLYQANNHL